MKITPSSRVALHRELLRWHFWAGLLSLPLALVLAISGGIYLFKPHYTEWQEQRLEINLPAISSAALSPDQLLEQLQNQFPNSDLKRFTLAREPDRSVEFLLDYQGRSYNHWVDQYTGQLLARSPQDQSLMTVVKNLHGELLLGNGGSYVVELMAQWMIVLIISGLILYSGRRTSNNSAPLAKRLHTQVGLWLGGFILLLLISGLPWTQVWGNGFKKFQEVMDWRSPGQEWRVTLQSQPNKVTAFMQGSELWQIRESDNNPVLLQSSQASAQIATQTSPISLSTIVDKAKAMALPHPVIVMPPNSANGVWTVRSMTPNRPERVTRHFDRWSGEALMTIKFNDYHPVKRLVSYGVAFHEGALFGTANLIICVITAMGLVALCLSAIWSWIHRSPARVPAKPLEQARTRTRVRTNALPVFFWPVSAALMLLLPLFGASVVVIFLMGKLKSYFSESLKRRRNASESLR